MIFDKQKLKIVVFIGCVLLAKVAFAQSFFIAPNGNDSGNGSIKHPLKTIEKAFELALEIKNKGKEKPISIYFRKGTYNIQNTIQLDRSLSNLKLEAYQEEHVTFFGGLSIPVSQIKKAYFPSTKFHKKRTVHTVDLKSQGITNYGSIKNVGFARPYGPSWGEIFVNKKEMVLSRWPNKGMIPIGKVLNKGSIPRYDDFEDKGGIIKYDSLRIDGWKDEKDAWMAGYFMWGYADDMVKIANINPEQKTLQTATATMYGFGDDKPWRNWYGVNILTELDTNREYYIDRTKGLLYFMLQDENITSLDLSILETPFISMKGAKNVLVKGISFECSRGIGVAMSNTENVTIKGCSFKNLGGLGVIVGKGIEPFLKYRHEGNGNAKADIMGSLHQHLYANTTFNREGGKNNKIIGCEFYQLGAGGVSIGGGNRLTLEKGNNSVENCVFHDLNRIEKSYRPAVDITGVGNKIIHCEMYNTPSMAILMHGNDHLIEYNYIHDVCLEIEDQGAFYYGRDPSERGAVVRYNYFENIPDQFSTSAVYSDDGACGLIVDSNVFYKAGKYNVLLGGGSDNIYTNNIFIGTKFGIHVDNRLQNWSKGILEKGGLVEKRLNAVNFQKPPYSVQYPNIATYWNNADLPTGNLVENNVFYKVGTLLDGKEQWLDYKESNWKTDEDLKFADEENKNFTLNTTSIVYKRLPNFKEIPFNDIGLQNKEK